MTVVMHDAASTPSSRDGKPKKRRNRGGKRRKQQFAKIDAEYKRRLIAQWTLVAAQTLAAQTLASQTLASRTLDTQTLVDAQPETLLDVE